MCVLYVLVQRKLFVLCVLCKIVIKKMCVFVRVRVLGMQPMLLILCCVLITITCNCVVLCVCVVPIPITTPVTTPIFISIYAVLCVCHVYFVCVYCMSFMCVSPKEIKFVKIVH